MSAASRWAEQVGNTPQFCLRRHGVSVALARELEAIARQFHHDTRCDSVFHAQEAFLIARACSLLTVPRRMSSAGGAYIMVNAGNDRLFRDDEAGHIYFDTRSPPVEIQETIAHEVGHYLIWRLGRVAPPSSPWRELAQLWNANEAAADYLGRAIMLPRSFDRDLNDTWDLHELHRRHPNVTYEALALRICELRPAIMTVLDGRGVMLRAASPWLPRQRHRLEAAELGAASRATSTGSVSAAEGVCAYPLVTRRGTRRTIVVRALEGSASGAVAA